jgi:hypothetical protein
VAVAPNRQLRGRQAVQAVVAVGIVMAAQAIHLQLRQAKEVMVETAQTTEHLIQAAVVVALLRLAQLQAWLLAVTVAQERHRLFLAVPQLILAEAAALHSATQIHAERVV